jgi:hypothetical protein
LVLVLDSDARSVELRRIVVTESGRGYGKRVVSMIVIYAAMNSEESECGWMSSGRTSGHDMCTSSAATGGFGESEHEGRSLLLYEKAV